MKQDRRRFIKTATAGLALTAITGHIAGCKSSSLSGSGAVNDFGLQLYTLRDVLHQDPKGVLKQVAEMGYKYIETYNHDTLGMFGGMTNIEFKRYLDEIGLTVISAHYKPDINFEKRAAEVAAIGIKFLIYPYEGSPYKKRDIEYATMPKTIDEFKKMADDFNRYGEVCRKYGIRFAFHNHDYTFSLLEDQIPQDILLKYTNKDLVDFEMDIYWVVTAGEDPIKWLNKYPGRFKLLHVKDRQKNVSPSEREGFSILGKGSIDLPAILKAAKKSGVQYFMIEQDQTYDIPVMKAVKESADYLKGLKI